MSTYFNRKLNAILFADIAGYTSLMQKSEKTAVGYIDIFKKIVEETTEKFHGEVVQYYGDGSLLAFGSSINAVQCAIEMQNSFCGDNPVPVRIGIHIGDILIKDGNYFGSGVNIASRIESMAVPGSVLISKNVRDEIRNKENFQLVLLGSFHFKNVDEEIPVYALSNPGLMIPDKMNLTGKFAPESIKKKFKPWTLLSLLVLFLIYWGISNFGGQKSSENLQDILYKGKRYVLAIGIDEYPNWMNLKNAKNDALSLAETLQNLYGFQLLFPPLVDEQASKENIEKILSEASNVVKENDQLVVFYAGHGYNSSGQNEFESDGYLVPYHADADEELSDLISLETFLKDISSIPAQHITTIVDACYSGLALNNHMFVSRGINNDLLKLAKSKSRKIFSSADYDQVAIDNGPLKSNSLFTGILISGLVSGDADINVDGYITMSELFIYLESNILERSNNNQSPQYGYLREDKGGEMLLSYDSTMVKPALTIKSKNKNTDVYTALPFRTSTPKEAYPGLNNYFSEVIIRALSAHNNGDYRVLSLERFFDEEQSHQEVLSKTSLTKYFWGSYTILGDKITVYITLHDAKERYVLYSFPEIQGNLNDLDLLASEIQSRVRGFLTEEKSVLAKLASPPNYEAYKLYVKGRTVLRKEKDGKTARKYLQQAIEIDSSYFPAYVQMVWTHITGKTDMAQAKEEYQKLFLPKFKLLDFEETEREYLGRQITGDFDAVSKLYYDFYDDFKIQGIFTDALWYALASNNFSRYEKLKNHQYHLKPSEALDYFVLRRDNEYYQMIRKKPPDYLDFVRDFETRIEEEGNKSRYKELIGTYTLFGCRKDCFAEINQKFLEKGLTDYDYYKKLGLALEREDNKLDDALRAFNVAKAKLSQNLSLESSDININDRLFVDFKTKDFKLVINTFNQYRSEILGSIDAPISTCYYLLARLKTEGSLSGPDKNLIENNIFTNFQEYLGLGWYYLGVVYAHLEEMDKAMYYLRKSTKAGFNFSPFTFQFDRDLSPIWDHPEFLLFVKPK